MANTLTVKLSDGSVFSGTMAEIRAAQSDIIAAVVGDERQDLRKASADAGQAAYDAHMDAFYAEAQKSGEVDASAIREASAEAGRLSRIAKQAVYKAAGRLECPNFDTCGGLRKPQFRLCARCDGKA